MCILNITRYCFCFSDSWCLFILVLCTLLVFWGLVPSPGMLGSLWRWVWGIVPGWWCPVSRRQRTGRRPVTTCEQPVSGLPWHRQACSPTWVRLLNSLLSFHPLGSCSLHDSAQLVAGMCLGRAAHRTWVPPGGFLFYRIQFWLWGARGSPRVSAGCKLLLCCPGAQHCWPGKACPRGWCLSVFSGFSLLKSQPPKRFTRAFNWRF